jgi:PUA-domain protein
MAEIRIRKRRRLRNKETKALVEEIRAKTGTEIFSSNDPVDIANSSDFDVIFIDGEILAMVIEGRAFPTIRGILKYGSERFFVTVDMGAVPYVANGADIMAPGVVDADTEIREGDLVWIRDEKNCRPLAIGKALMSGSEMVAGGSGKAVSTLHFVGDKLWKYDDK